MEKHREDAGERLQAERIWTTNRNFYNGTMTMISYVTVVVVVVTVVVPGKLIENFRYRDAISAKPYPSKFQGGRVGGTKDPLFSDPSIDCNPASESFAAPVR